MLSFIHNIVHVHQQKWIEFYKCKLKCSALLELPNYDFKLKLLCHDTNE